jgi:hypothetical protein
MGSKSSKSIFAPAPAPPPPPPPTPTPPPPPTPTITTYAPGTSIFKVPDNSSTIDIDVPNLQKCINSGGGSPCINNYIQGYDTSTNMFVPTTNVVQGFELVENFDTSNNYNIVLIVLVMVYIIILVRK